jgi:hypothetical protein
MDNYSSLPLFFSDLHASKIYSCSTVHHNGKGTPTNFGPKLMKLKKWDIMGKVKGGTSTACWNDKREVYFSPTCMKPQLQVTMWTKKEMHLNLCTFKFTTGA